MLHTVQYLLYLVERTPAPLILIYSNVQCKHFQLITLCVRQAHRFQEKGVVDTILIELGVYTYVGV